MKPPPTPRFRTVAGVPALRMPSRRALCTLYIPALRLVLVEPPPTLQQYNYHCCYFQDGTFKSTGPLWSVRNRCNILVDNLVWVNVVTQTILASCAHWPLAYKRVIRTSAR